MKLKWFYFTPAADGFDVIIRDQGADNGDVISDLSVRGEDFKQFVNEVLASGLESVAEALVDEILEEEAVPIKGVPDETPPSSDSEWADEPKKPEPAKKAAKKSSKKAAKKKGE